MGSRHRPARRGEGAQGPVNLHFDSIGWRHHDAYVRTTVTLDRDVEVMVRDAMHRSRRSFKETLNEALRAGLGRKASTIKTVPFVVKSKPMGLKPGIDPGSLNQLADELEVEAFVASEIRTRREK